jgi:phosphotransferase system HPr-like phosphotransfer protein
MEIKSSECKNKRILFVYRDFSHGTTGNSATECIIESLKKKYDITTYRNLDENVIKLISSASPGKRFNAMVTHVPHKASSGRALGAISHHMRETAELIESYQDSLLILRQIKIITDIPIIAYTGAGDSPIIANIFWEGGGVDHIVPKTTDLHKDLKEISDALETFIQKYEKLPSTIPEPTIKIEGNFTTTEVRVNLNGGVGLTAAAAIARECENYQGNVLLKKVNRTKETEAYYAKSTLALLGAQIHEGEKITVLIHYPYCLRGG